MYKLILLDLDGTLLRSDKTISDYTLSVLNNCRKKNIKIAVSTARGESNAKSFLSAVNPDIIISSSGAVVKYDDKVIYSSSFSERETKTIITKSFEIEKNCEITVDTVDKHYWNYKTDPHIQSPDWGDVVFTDYSNFNEKALKICVELKSEVSADLISKSVRECDYARFSDGNWYKFTKSDATKSKALAAVLDVLNITYDNVVSFGDDYVDIEMLRLCNKGIAVENAIDEVKSVADEITESNDNDGVAKWIEKNILIQQLNKKTDCKFFIREAKKGDCRRISEVKKDVWETAYKNIYPKQKISEYNIEMQAKKFEDILDGSDKELYVAVLENRVVGYMCCGSNFRKHFGNTYEIILLNIQSGYRGCGIGKSLFMTAVNEFINNKIEKFIIACNKYNYPAHRFYEKWGDG